MLASTAQGRDVKLGEGRVQGYRNFGTKLWNAARFCELHGCDLDPAFDPGTAREIVNRWVISKLARAAARTHESLEGYRFNEAASALYHFTWNEFCDWYLELAKPSLEANAGDRLQETRATAGWVLAQLLHLLHPLTPFVTRGAVGAPLRRARRPADRRALAGTAGDADRRGGRGRARLADPAGDRGARRAQRAGRAGGGAAAACRRREASPTTQARLRRHDEAIRRLARCADIAVATGPVPAGAVQVVVDEATYALPLAGVIDLGQERRRLDRELARIATELERFDQKLANPNFLDRAPAEVIEEQRARRADAEEARQKLAAARARIAS